jgi:hypothetical protein
VNINRVVLTGNLTADPELRRRAGRRPPGCAWRSRLKLDREPSARIFLCGPADGVLAVVQLHDATLPTDADPRTGLVVLHRSIAAACSACSPTPSDRNGYGYCLHAAWGLHCRAQTLGRWDPATSHKLSLPNSIFGR